MDLTELEAFRLFEDAEAAVEAGVATDQTLGNLERVVHWRVAAYGKTDPRTVEAVAALYKLADARSDNKRAAQYGEELLGARMALGGYADWQTRLLLFELAWTYEELGDVDTALELLRQYNDATSQYVAPDNINIAASLKRMAFMHYERDDYEKCEKCARESVAIARTESGEFATRTLGDALSALVLGLHGQGKSSEALAPAREAIRLHDQTLGPQAEMAILSRIRLCMVMCALQMGEQAESAIREVDLDAMGPCRPGYGLPSTVEQFLGASLERQGRWREASSHFFAAAYGSAIANGPAAAHTKYLARNAIRAAKRGGDVAWTVRDAASSAARSAAKDAAEAGAIDALDGDFESIVSDVADAALDGAVDGAIDSFFDV